MSPVFQRKLRAMSTAFIIVLSLAVAGVLAWGLRRFEVARGPKPTPVSLVLDEVFGEGSSNTEDSLLLEKLLKHRSASIDDVTYVEQVRRLMVNTQKIDDARTFLRDVDRRRTINPDEFKLQVAWVDLAAAQSAWSFGEESKANALLANAVSAANELRVKWPEWSQPYRILEEASRVSWAKPATDPAPDYSQLEQKVRSRFVNGAYVRSLMDWQPITAVFAVSAIGMLGLCAGMSGLLSIRQMTRLPSAQITATQPGYVALRGTLQLLPNTAAVIGPYSKERGVWYELESRSGFKNSRTTYEHSAQHFLLRDASGEATIDPTGINVKSKHTAGTFGSNAGFGSSGHTYERLLKEDDVAYVLGELTVTTGSNGKTERTVRVAKDGRNLLVSNYSEETLISFEKLWLGIGLSVFVLSALLLAWSFYQRYNIKIFPGVLE